MGQPSAQPGRIAAVARELESVFDLSITSQMLEWHLDMLTQADDDVDQVLETDEGEFVVADLIRYVLAALPRSVVLSDERANQADALRGELRQYVGGCL